MFSAGTASWISAASELKIRISVSGMRMIMLHMTAVVAERETHDQNGFPHASRSAGTVAVAQDRGSSSTMA